MCIAYRNMHMEQKYKPCVWRIHTNLMSMVASEKRRELEQARITTEISVIFYLFLKKRSKTNTAKCYIFFSFQLVHI